MWGGHPEWHICGDALKVLQGGEFSTMDYIIHTSFKVFNCDFGSFLHISGGRE